MSDTLSQAVSSDTLSQAMPSNNTTLEELEGILYLREDELRSMQETYDCNIDRFDELYEIIDSLREQVSSLREEQERIDTITSINEQITALTEEMWEDFKPHQRTSHAYEMLQREVTALELERDSFQYV